MFGHLNKGQCKECKRGDLKIIVNKSKQLCYFHNAKRLYEISKHKRSNRSIHKVAKRVTATKSTSSKERQKEYRRAKAEWMPNHPICEIKQSPHCTGRNDAPHHTRGRIGKFLIDTKWWIASCNACNRWVEEYPKKARELGFSHSRTATTF